MRKSAPAADPDAYVHALDGWRRTCVAMLRGAVRKVARLEETVKWGHLVYAANGPALLIRAEDERVLLGFWRGHSLDRALWADTDGFSARYYTRDTLADLFNTFFEKTSVDVYGQEADALPLPRHLRALVRPLFSDDYLKRKVRERGGFLFITADK